MGASVVLYRGIEKVINNHELTFEGKQDGIADLFIKSCFMLPENLAEDLDQFYLDTGIGSGGIKVKEQDQLRELAYHLVDVLDLFDMDYDDKKDPLVLDEWITLKNLFSNYSDDIEDDLLTYIMQFAIEKGAFR